MHSALILTILISCQCYCQTDEDEDEDEDIITYTQNVFVYGTLKTGNPNHHHMFKKGLDAAVFLGLARTIELYPLIIHTPFNLPFLLHEPGTGNHISGELYWVTNETFYHLDQFERHPELYERRKVNLSLLTDGSRKNLSKPIPMRGWLYGLARFNRSLLQLPQLESYDPVNLTESQQYRIYNPETDESLAPYLFDNNSTSTTP